MAISKILHMKESGVYLGRHLKTTIDYVMNPEKTQDGRLIGAVNCQPEFAFEQMRNTKRRFNKPDKRQGYHLIISFTENEVTPDMAFEIANKFTNEYLEKEYEAVFVVHDNTEHIHAHIVFNSVSFVDGRKYRYEKGDWEREIQPITNRLCREYGLSEIALEGEKEKNKSNHYKEWNENRDGKFVWSDMIKRDIDACILQSYDMENFLDMLKDKGYEIKIGKHLAVKPMGMKRYRRLDTLGAGYETEAIMKRIESENLKTYRQKESKSEAAIVKCYVKRYKRANMSGLQKKYYKRLYRLGLLKKRAYSQAWKYKEDIKRMDMLQQQYLFLSKHGIHSTEDLSVVVSNLTDKKKEAMREKRKVYRESARNEELFKIAEEMSKLVSAEEAYNLGDDFFIEEHKKWNELSELLKGQGYSYMEVEVLKSYYKEQKDATYNNVRKLSKELRLGERILGELNSDEFVYEFEREEHAKKEEIIRKRGNREHTI